MKAESFVSDHLEQCVVHSEHSVMTERMIELAEKEREGCCRQRAQCMPRHRAGTERAFLQQDVVVMG